MSTTNRNSPPGYGDLEPVLRELIDFIETGKTGDALEFSQKVLGVCRLRLSCIKTLSWLKTRARVRLSRPVLKLPGSDWGADVRKLIESVRELDATFEVHASSVDFRDEIDEATRRSVEKYVDRKFKPPLSN